MKATTHGWQKFLTIAAAAVAARRSERLCDLDVRAEDPPKPEPTPTPPPGTPAPPAPTQAPPAAGDNKVEHIPRAAMRRIKEEERQRGKQAATSELDAEAKRYGFNSVAEALAAAAAGKAAPAPGKGAPAPTEPPPARGGGKAEKLLAQERQSRIDAQRKANRLQRDLDAQAAEGALRERAWGLGITDTKYAIHLLKEHCAELTAGISDEKDRAKALDAFDEGKFLEGLKATHSYLYGERPKPAQTTAAPAPGKAAPPAPPKPRDAAEAAGAKPDIDKMSKEEFRQYMQGLGYNMRGSGHVSAFRQPKGGARA